MKDIKALVLVTGQQIIGKIEEEGDFITVESPRTIIKPEPGVIDLSAFPIGGSLKGTIIIKNPANHVIVITDLDDSVEKHYLSSITGLTL